MRSEVLVLFKEPAKQLIDASRNQTAGLFLIMPRWMAVLPCDDAEDFFDACI